MLIMIFKMSAVTGLYILLTVILWRKYKSRELKRSDQVIIGIIYGLCSVLSTHVGVNFGDMLLNVRDLGPLAAGLFFHPLAGVISGLIGGIERYIAGTYFNIGAYTRYACSISTCLAGFLAWYLNKRVFQGKNPLPEQAFFMGAVMEVFHMYVVIITHRNDMSMAYYVVKNCAGPMIIFTGLGLAICAHAIRVASGEERPPRAIMGETVPIFRRFQFWLFLVTATMLLLSFGFTYAIQTQSALQNARAQLINYAGNLQSVIDRVDSSEIDMNQFYDLYNDNENSYALIDSTGKIVVGDNKGDVIPSVDLDMIRKNLGDNTFTMSLFGTECLCHSEPSRNDLILITFLSSDEIYAERDIQALETALASILLFTVIYMLVQYLVQEIVVDDLYLVNRSLSKITHGDLNEVVNVRNSLEFASLSDDINQTVDTLKGYIKEAEQRIEDELVFARTIQDASLPKVFELPREDLEIYASMDPAKEVGGDFYDFFFINADTLVLVIADVSGKGIPAALFMMRAKTAIRSMATRGNSPAEILFEANNNLCEGNDAEMFVTAWVGIIDLASGKMRCANAGHEYPAIMRAGGKYELFKDKHTMPLATIENIPGKEYDLYFNPGDRLFVYTDGVPEAINPNMEDYGTGRMLAKLNSLNEDEDVSPVEDLLALRQDISIFAGEAEQFDDITMLEFRYWGKEKN